MFMVSIRLERNARNDNRKFQDRGGRGGASKILFRFLKLMVVAYLLYVCCEYYFVCFNYLVNFFI